MKKEMMMADKHALNKKRQGGFTIAEALLVLGLVVGGAALAGAGYSAYQNTRKPQTVAEDTAALIAKIQSVYGPNGDYTTLSTANLVKMITFPFKSFKYDGTNIVDAYGNAVSFDGSAVKFAMLLGTYGQDACSTIAANARNYAYNVNLGSAAALTGSAAGTINAAVGTVFKSGDTVTQSAIATGCNGGGAKVALEIR